MPRVDADLKLDFKDVLFRPKRSSLKSRSEVGTVYSLSSDYVIQGLQLQSLTQKSVKNASQKQGNLLARSHIQEVQLRLRPCCE